MRIKDKVSTRTPGKVADVFLEDMPLNFLEDMGSALPNNFRGCLVGLFLPKRDGAFDIYGGIRIIGQNRREEVEVLLWVLSWAGGATFNSKNARDSAIILAELCSIFDMLYRE